MFLRTLAAIVALLLVSCGSVRLPVPDIGAYRMEIQQGNFVSEEMISRLKLGMSKDQVRFILGTALITDSFHADRWDYVFRRQKVNSSELEQRKLAVFFDGGKLASMESDLVPGAGADVAAVKMPEATKAEVPAAKPEATAARSAAPAPKTAMPAAKREAPAPKPDPIALKRDAPAAKPEAHQQPTSGLVAETSSATPIPSVDKQPQEKQPLQQQPLQQQPQERRSWWERLKESVKF